MEIQRDDYLNKLISCRFDGQIKIITGLRRVGKSYLLFTLYRNFLLANGTKPDHIIGLQLDLAENAEYRDPLKLDTYVRKRILHEDEQYFVFLDEIQNVRTIENPQVSGDKIGFYDVSMGLMAKKNIDLYITGSNSHMLSKDVATQFRGRGEEINVRPLSFFEFLLAFPGDEEQAWQEYYTYGGMPMILSKKDAKDKMSYLNGLRDQTYLKDIVERNGLKNDSNINDLVKVLSSVEGSLTSTLNLANTFRSEKKSGISRGKVDAYISYLEDSFLIAKAPRYDINGRHIIGAPLKYYFTDVGLMNAWRGFLHIEENRIMENLVFNELLLRGYSVDVGVVEVLEKNASGDYVRKNTEVDFVATNGNDIFYIQCAFDLSGENKEKQEKRPLLNIKNSFKKIIVIENEIMPKHDENGITTLGIRRFLKDKSSLNL